MKKFKIEPNKMELEVDTPPWGFPKIVSKTANKNTSIDLNKLLFVDPYANEDSVIRPTLCDVGNFLQQSGVLFENLQAGLLIYIAFNSVKLGYPIPVVFKTNDLPKARHLLNLCKQIAPKDSFREVHELKYEQLYNDENYFKGRVIVCQDASGVKKAMPDLLMLLTQGYSTRQENYKSKLGAGIQDHTIEYPLGFIGIEPNDSKSFLDHPAVIKISLANVDCFNSQMMPIVLRDMFQQQHQVSFIEARRIAKIFERMKYQKVDTRCFDHAALEVSRQKPNSLREKINVMKKVLSLITIMNHPKKVTAIEIYNSFIEANIRNIDAEPEASHKLTATKVEYFISKTLLKDVITIKNESLTADEIKIFEAVKKINFGKLQSALIARDNIRDKLWLLINNHTYWAKKEEIFKQVNNNSSEILSLPVIEKGLYSLNKMDFIAAKRIEGSRRYGYYIVVPEANDSIKLPHPSQIIDPIFQGQSIKVVNPMSGDIETI